MKEPIDYEDMEIAYHWDGDNICVWLAVYPDRHHYVRTLMGDKLDTVNIVEAIEDVMELRDGLTEPEQEQVMPIIETLSRAVMRQALRGRK